MQFATRRTKSQLTNYLKTPTIRSAFRLRVEQKQNDRAMNVAISKYYDIVNPADGEKRIHSHSRKGLAIGEDCQFAAFSSASMVMSPTGNVDSSRSFAVPSDGNAHAMAVDIVKRGMELIDLIGAEVDAGIDCVDKRWEPDLPYLDNQSSPRCGRMLNWLLGGGDVLQKLESLCGAAQDVLKGQPVVSEVPVPAKVFGDVHGQLRDLLLLFHFYGRPGHDANPPENVDSPSSGRRRPRAPSGHTHSEASQVVPLGSEAAQVSYVFNGDWVDRGRRQLEVVTLLLALKVVYPTLVWLNRGNHEDVAQNLKTSRKGNLGFDRACDEQLGLQDGPKAFAAFHRVFEWLPLAARIENRILVLHGGLGSGDWTLDTLRAAERPLRSTNLASALDGAVYNILWSDPLQPNRRKPEKTFGVHPSARSKHSTVMKGFGRDITERFCAQENLGLVIRSHQFKQSGKGYELTHDGWLMRVFSARNYCGEAANDGGLLLIGRAEGTPDTLLVRPQNVERMTRPKRAPTLPNCDNHAEPYCPRAHLMQLVEPGPPRGCLSLSRILRDLKENVECNECGAEDLQAGCYFHCGGCSNHDLCLDCAARASGSVCETTPDFLSDSSSDDSDGEAPAPTGPTLLGSRSHCPAKQVESSDYDL